jgi:hypothetical protein
MEGTVLEARKRVSGSDHPDTLASAGNLAVTLFKLGRFDETVRF